MVTRSALVSSGRAYTDVGAFLVGAHRSVADAMDCVRRNGRDLAVVTDDGGMIIGTVTDSDVRRFTLAGGQLDAPVAEAMSTKPVTADAGLSDDRILALLRSHRIRSVPVVERGSLVEVRSVDGFPYWSAPPTAVIMAGGRGQRLRPVTDKLPKPLLKVGSMSIIERIIRDLAAAGVVDVYLAVNYKAEIFQERLGFGEPLGVNLHYLREETAMGTAGALSLLPDGQRGPVVVSNGDIVTTVDFSRLFDFHWRLRGAVTVAGVEHLSHIPYGVLNTVEHHLISIEEKPVRRDFCSAGIYVLDSEILALVPGSRRFDMPDLIADALAAGLPVHVFPVLEKWFDIGGTADFERVLVQFALGEHD
jgi:dTDP-glucose pyrophosphorylase